MLFPQQSPFLTSPKVTLACQRKEATLTGSPRTDKATMPTINIDAAKPYAPVHVWGKVWVISESDAIGDWLEPGVTFETIAAAFAD